MKNVILLTIDTLRKDVLGCYGNTDGLTPFLDSIMDKCIVFENSQSVGPYTQASFPGILASSYYLEFGREQMLNTKKVLICEPLKRNGVTTAAFHSNPFMCDFFGWNRGWDTFYDSMDDEEHISDHCPYIKGNLINDKVADWLKGHVSGPDYNRFFLWAHYMDVHEPYVPARKYIDQIDSSITLTDDEMFELFTKYVLPRDASDAKVVELLKKLYLAHVIEVDEYAKRFFDILEQNGVLQDSVIIITSDHGDEFGDHGALSHDGKMYNELTNVPLIIYDPSMSGNQVSENVMSGVDVPPTVLHLFGLDNEPGYYGSSVLPLDSYEPKHAFAEAIGKLQHKMKPEDKPAHSLRSGSLKLIHREDNDSHELYDLETDPGEKSNIIESSSASEGLKTQLAEFIKRNAT